MCRKRIGFLNIAADVGVTRTSGSGVQSRRIGRLPGSPGRRHSPQKPFTRSDKEILMKKAIAMRVSWGFVFCLLTAFAVFENAEGATIGGLPLPMNIAGTSWAGELTTVESSGSTAFRNVTVSFETQDGNFISGIMKDTDTDETITAFSGIVGPLNPYLLHLTGPNRVMLGDVVRRGRINRLFVRGSDTASGSSFMGVLVRQ
jgi:hypothetical protein